MLRFSFVTNSYGELDLYCPIDKVFPRRKGNTSDAGGIWTRTALGKTALLLDRGHYPDMQYNVCQGVA